MSLFISMALFSLSMSISPGPVNFIALSSGLNYGFYRSFGYVFGATLGFVLLLFFIGYGLLATKDSIPSVVVFLKYVGCGYLIYMGYRMFISSCDATSIVQHNERPSFFQGMCLQWLNPKAWVACLTGCSAFNVYQSQERLVLFVSIYFVVCYLGISCWALLGKSIQTLLQNPAHTLLFNKIMGIVLAILGVTLGVFDLSHSLSK